MGFTYSTEECRFLLAYQNLMTVAICYLRQTKSKYKLKYFFDIYFKISSRIVRYNYLVVQTEKQQDAQQRENITKEESCCSVM